MGLRSPQPINRDQAMAERLAEMEQRLNQLEGARTTAWAPLPFAAGFGNYESGNVTCKYSKDSNGIVRIQGVVKATSAYSYGASVATLPESYRPGLNIPFPTLYFDGTNVGALYFTVLSDGRMILNGTLGTTANTRAAGSWISLYSMSFAASLG